MKFPTPVYMADISRAMATPPPPAQQQLAPRVPQDNQARSLAQQAADDAAAKEKRAAKNERDRLRRKEKRAADAKAAKAAAAKPKKKKAKKTLQVTPRRDWRKSARAAATPAKKKRGRGRPPGSKNKLKPATLLMLEPAAPRRPGRPPKAATSTGMLDRIQQAVSLLNGLPEHARKVVLDAVK